MALKKRIELSNGIVVEYHRITSLRIFTNIQNTVVVASYVSQNKREEERDAIKNFKPMDVYIDTKYYNFSYDQTMSIEDAYNALKQLPDFEGATDVLEEGQVLSLSEE